LNEPSGSPERRCRFFWMGPVVSFTDTADLFEWAQQRP
jgi:hypothetical protein